MRNDYPTPEPGTPPPQEKEKFDFAVREAVSQAYKAVAVNYKDRLMDPSAEEVYWQPMCQEFSEELFLRLKGLGFEPSYVYINKLPQHLQAGLRHHIFLTAKGPNHEDYFVDGTWQQLAEKPDKNNKLLFEKADQVAKAAESKGIPADVRGLWAIGAYMLDSRKALRGTSAGKKTAIKHAVCTKLNITEKELDDFLGLKSNFGLETSKRIFETITAEAGLKK